MKQNLKNSKPLNFKWRKTVHYSLIFSILLIQIAIAGFFYNEYSAKEKLSFIEKQLKSIRNVENLTKDSKKELYNAQEFLQQYSINENPKFLESYFNSIKKLETNLAKINVYKNDNPTLIRNLVSAEKDFPKKNSLKNLIDSTYQYSTNVGFNKDNNLPKLNKLDVNFDFEIPEVQTQTFSDTVQKKGIFGRLKDAISGKENVRKDSTVVTVQKTKPFSAKKLKSQLDSVINSVNNHYYVQVQKIQVTNDQKKNRDKNSKSETVSMFTNLLKYSNDLMNIYENAVNTSKLELEKELKNQNSQSNKIRNYLVIASMALMFLVSIFIMYFTRMAFMYERKLKVANLQITENLNFKNRILGMFSHELRSPLKIIDIYINKINKKTTDNHIKEHLKSISFTNKTLLMQANQILEYTKNQQVENKLIPEIFNLKSEIQSILRTIEPYVETRNNRFLITENIDSDIMVYSDPTKINQIFTNILANANKFTENGDISIDTTSKKRNESTIILQTSISDTGVGISKSDLKQIFEPYYQGIISKEIANLGAGLGLSLCKEIIELFDGKIAVESTIGKGTTVNFSIKLKIANESEK